MSALEVSDEQLDAEVELPDGSCRHYGRGWLEIKSTGFRYSLCSACANVLTMIMGGDAGLRSSYGLPLALDPARSLGLRPFCANPECFVHMLEVPDAHQETEVGLPNGATRPYTRDWLLFETEARKYPLCDTCGNIAAALRGDGEGLPAPVGTSIEGQLIDPDGRVIERREPEPDPDADIVEPRILH